MKPYTPQIRVISVDHDRTVLTSRRLRHAMDLRGLQGWRVHNVFCHLEAGRCGVPAGVVAVEVDGSMGWLGKEMSEELADRFSEGLIEYARQQGGAGSPS